MPQRLNVPNSVVRGAGSCRWGQACLEDADHELCAVKPAARGKVMFLTSQVGHYCPYQTPLGSGLTCTCPVRQVICERTRE